MIETQVSQFVIPIPQSAIRRLVLCGTGRLTRRAELYISKIYIMGPGIHPLTHSPNDLVTSDLPMTKKLLFFVFVAVSTLLYCVAKAEVYDDFRGENIDLSKWTIQSAPGVTPGLFTQSKGRLHFSCNRDVGESLVSTRSFGAGFFRMELSKFYSSNDAQPGRGLGSYVALGLGPRENYVRMLRGRVITGGYFEANYFANNSLQLWYEPTAADAGQLALYHDGSTISFFYNNGLDPDKGWQRVGPRVTPGWNSSPTLFIKGYPGASGRTTFDVHKVEYLPLPLPPSLQKKLER